MVRISTLLKELTTLSTIKGNASIYTLRNGEALLSPYRNLLTFIHFYSKRTTIEEGLKLGDIEISPKPLVRWLGVFLDSKLTFK
jgi:hypothetical protein